MNHCKKLRCEDQGRSGSAYLFNVLMATWSIPLSRAALAKNNCPVAAEWMGRMDCGFIPGGITIWNKSLRFHAHSEHHLNLFTDPTPFPLMELLHHHRVDLAAPVVHQRNERHFVRRWIRARSEKRSRFHYPQEGTNLIHTIQISKNIQGAPPDFNHGLHLLHNGTAVLISGIERSLQIENIPHFPDHCHRLKQSGMNVGSDNAVQKATKAKTLTWSSFICAWVRIGGRTRQPTTSAWVTSSTNFLAGTGGTSSGSPWKVAEVTKLYEISCSKNDFTIKPVPNRNLSSSEEFRDKTIKTFIRILFKPYFYSFSKF